VGNVADIEVRPAKLAVFHDCILEELMSVAGKNSERD
jgi:hypothetical protein